MPELKSGSLTVGRKALHSKPAAGFNSPSNRSFNRYLFLSLILSTDYLQPGDPKLQQPYPGRGRTKWSRRRSRA